MTASAAGVQSPDRAVAIETSSLHLDILRDLRRIHSHICSVAYPVLEAAGELPARESVTGEAAATDALPVRLGPALIYVLAINARCCAIAPPLRAAAADDLTR